MPLDRLNPQHKDRFRLVLVAFATLFLKDPARELDGPRVQIYWNVLEQWDIEQIEAAGRTLLGEMASFPKPVHFRRVLERDAKKRRKQSLTTAPTEGIYCEYCEDTSMGVWWYGEDGAGPARQIPLAEFRRIETAQQRPSKGGLVDTGPRHRWGKCACRGHNPNWQRRAEERAVPYSPEDGAWDPNKWSHEEASAALDRYVPGHQGRMW